MDIGLAIRFSLIQNLPFFILWFYGFYQLIVIQVIERVPLL